jgi:hypothetical protein
MDLSSSLIILGVALLVFGQLGAWVAGQKGRRPVEGFLLGLFLGPLGVIVEGQLPELEAEAVGPARTSGRPGESVAQRLQRERDERRGIRTGE